MPQHLEYRGFNSLPHEAGAASRPATAIAGLAASAALATGTLIAATAVSIGIARAGALDAVIDNESGVFAIALLLGVLFIAASCTNLASRRDIGAEPPRPPGRLPIR